ncbi:hypothetical protein ACOT1L_12895 [Enterobacter cloacae complex sp. XJL004]|uniref:hypothetical protein n=1 Tax=unclassified Enterobacter cloacae complex TaxID=2757714 RepID=UPI003B9D377B
MSTITRQWLQQKISEMESTRDEIPFGLGDDDSNTLVALRIALASLEAEPAGCDACGGNGSVDIDHGEMGIEHIECPKCYTAPPAPVDVPDDVSGPLAHAYKELTPHVASLSSGTAAVGEVMDKSTTELNVSDENLFMTY